jgi:histidinol-phosphate aminotransferase
VTTSFTVAAVPHRAKLDQNESPLDLPPEAKQAVLEALSEASWNRYPQPVRYAEVKERFAAAIGQPPERVVLSVGGDQLILLAFWAAGGHGRRARVFEPSYPMFAHYAEVTQTPCERPVLGAGYDLAGRFPAGGSRVDLLFLCSPNNPTGTGPGRSFCLEALARHGLVLLDEAYADFSGESLLDLCPDHPNLLVARSLSKTMLAGVRLGYGVGDPELIATLERLLFAPYHLCELQLLCARHFELIRPALAARVAEIVAERTRLAEGLGRLGLHAWPSRANFILFEVEDAARSYRALLDQGVRVRDVSSMPGLARHLRVTIGTPEEDTIFLEALARAI